MDRTTREIGRALTAGVWRGELHPRGRDGKFIEKLGLVNLVEAFARDRNGHRVDLSGDRGQVVDIKPDPGGGEPNIAVRVMDRAGRPVGTLNVKPENVVQAPTPKARLDLGSGPRVPGMPAPAPMPDVGVPAQRPASLAADDVRRQRLLDKINPKIAQLDDTDVDVRAKQLDDILAKLRFSILDTDQTHDHLHPPDGEGGRWTRERHALHEEMWSELIAKVQASGIPRDRDALALGGLPGAGKSTQLRPGGKAEGFGVVAWETNSPIPQGATHVSINPDIVKEMLMDKGALPEGVDPHLKPMEQVTFLHEESSYLAKEWVRRLGAQGYNIVLDNTMDSPGGMLKRMTPLAEQGYKFRALFVDIPVEESIASAKARFARSALTPRGGRFVPSSVQGNRHTTTGRLSKNRDAFDTLVKQDWFTDWMTVDNTGVSLGTPRGEVTDSGQGRGSAASKFRRMVEASSVDTPGGPAGMARRRRGHATPGPYRSSSVGGTSLPGPDSPAPVGWPTLPQTAPLVTEADLAGGLP